jgi:hypothetical protein
MEKQPNSRICFVCGIENPIGLHLHFYTDDEGRCIARFRPKPEHQGYSGRLHGGLISTLSGRDLLAPEENKCDVVEGGRIPGEPIDGLFQSCQQLGCGSVAEG